MRLIEDGGLAAAVSTIAPDDSTPNTARALAFSRVVEALHSARTVLPMRYGCACRDEREVVDLLRIRGEEYATILRGLDGCVEMGVRILLPVPRASPRSSLVPKIGGTSGRAYLASRAAWYAEAEAARRVLAAPMERVGRALDRLAVRSTADRGLGTDPCLSALHFLVRREGVERFRGEFRRIERSESARLLLSGPWPPHNFTAPEQA